jgi:molecular chaperone GrpE
MSHSTKAPPPSGDAPKARDEAAAPPTPDLGASPDGQAPAPPNPEGPLPAKARECRNLVDQLQRLAAEYSNYQKRMQRVMDDEKQRAIGEVVLDLLPAIDNFERALAAAQEKPGFGSLLEGVRLVHAQLLAGLKKHGITPIEAYDKPFDPEHHEAVAHVPSQEHAAGRVIQEMHKGYLFDGRILRPSRVAVSKGKPGEEEGAPEPREEPAGGGESGDQDTRGG